MTKPAPKTRLLVVDADDEARTFVRRRFTRMGHEVMEASEHGKALSMIAMIPFDMVLLDLQTPGPDGACGLELLRRMRERRTAAELPIMAVAAETTDAAEALALGADDCLVRPLYVDVAHARTEMLLGREHALPADQAAKLDLQSRLETLKETAIRSEAVSAGLEERGHDLRAPLNGLVSSASVLTRICGTPELKPAIATIEAAVEKIDLIIVRALGRADRRIRAPKAKLRILLADDDAGSRMEAHELLRAADVEIELVEVDAGLEAALATDAMFFDLIMMNVAAPEAIAGIRAIRRAELQNSTRRTPILAYGTEAKGLTQAQEAGVHLCMRPPLAAERLLSALAEALARESDDVCAVA